MTDVFLRPGDVVPGDVSLREQGPDGGGATVIGSAVLSGVAGLVVAAMLIVQGSSGPSGTGDLAASGLCIVSESATAGGTSGVGAVALDVVGASAVMGGSGADAGTSLLLVPAEGSVPGLSALLGTGQISGQAPPPPTLQSGGYLMRELSPRVTPLVIGGGECVGSGGVVAQGDVLSWDDWLVLL